MLILFIIFVVVALILVTPVTLRLYAKYDNRKSLFDITLRLGFVNVYHKSTDRKSKEKTKNAKEGGMETAKDKQSPKDIIGFILEVKKEIKELIQVVLRYMTDHIVKFHKFKLHASLGLEDAAQTAVCYGASSAVLFNTVGALDKAAKIKGIDIDYKPDFTNENIFVEFEGIIRTSHFHILALVGILLRKGLPILKKRKG